MAYKSIEEIKAKHPKGAVLSNGHTKRQFSPYELWLEQHNPSSTWNEVSTKKAEEPKAKAQAPKEAQAEMKLQETPTEDGKEDTATKAK